MLLYRATRWGRGDSRCTPRQWAGTQKVELAIAMTSLMSPASDQTTATCESFLTSTAGGERHAIRLGATTIGSGAKCDLRLDSPDVKPLHCVLTRDASGVTARRWASGATVNGKPFTEVELSEGDQLAIGQVEFVLTVQQPHTQDTADGIRHAEEGSEEGNRTQTDVNVPAADTAELAAESNPPADVHDDSLSPIAGPRTAASADASESEAEATGAGSKPSDQGDSDSDSDADVGFLSKSTGTINPVPPHLLVPWTAKPTEPGEARSLLDDLEPTGPEDGDEESCSPAPPEPRTPNPHDTPIFAEDPREPVGEAAAAQCDGSPAEPTPSLTPEGAPAPRDWNAALATMRSRARRLIAALREQRASDAEARSLLADVTAERDQLGQRMSELQQQLSAEQADSSKTATQLANAEGDLARLREEHASLEQGFQQLQTQLNEALDALEVATLAHASTVQPAAPVCESGPTTPDLPTETLQADAAVHPVASQEISDPLADAASSWGGAPQAQAPQAAEDYWSEPTPAANAEPNAEEADASDADEATSWGQPLPAVDDLWSTDEQEPPAAQPTEPESASDEVDAWLKSFSATEKNPVRGAAEAPISSSDATPVAQDSLPTPLDEGVVAATPVVQAPTNEPTVEPTVEPTDAPMEAQPTGPGVDAWQSEPAEHRVDENPVERATPVEQDTHVATTAGIDPTHEVEVPAAAGFEAPEDNAPATGGFEEPKSFYEQYAHLLPGEDDESAAAPFEPASTPTPVATEATTPGEDAEEDIDAYMQQLLARMRGQEPAAPAPRPAQTEAAPPTPAPVVATAATPPQPGVQVDATPSVPESPLMSLEELSRSEMPERAKDMNSLRELANQSARQAIGVAASKQYKEKSLVNLIIAAIAFACGGFLIVASPGIISTQAICGGLALVWAGFWGSVSAKHLLRALQAGSSERKPVAARATEEELPITK